jgi:hypothetical protein
VNWNLSARVARPPRPSHGRPEPFFAPVADPLRRALSAGLQCTGTRVDQTPARSPVKATPPYPRSPPRLTRRWARGRGRAARTNGGLWGRRRTHSALLGTESRIDPRVVRAHRSATHPPAHHCAPYLRGGRDMTSTITTTTAAAIPISRTVYQSKGPSMARPAPAAPRG